MYIVEVLYLLRICLYIVFHGLSHSKKIDTKYLTSTFICHSILKYTILNKTSKTHSFTLHHRHQPIGLQKAGCLSKSQSYVF